MGCRALAEPDCTNSHFLTMIGFLYTSANTAATAIDSMTGKGRLVVDEALVSASVVKMRFDVI